MFDGTLQTPSVGENLNVRWSQDSPFRVNPLLNIPPGEIALEVLSQVRPGESDDLKPSRAAYPQLIAIVPPGSRPCTQRGKALGRKQNATDRGLSARAGSSPAFLKESRREAENGMLARFKVHATGRCTDVNTPRTLPSE
ncbi:hypothetical protein [Streptomyces sp. JJ38]|uniref:hypothetical protein n=1 Tax=Streptomyces sp. JJ38 TaxID=2738128 RepID=UPI001C59A6F3|nr:hypothetical protein [Streptomyces sp. JJ38]MBW1597292.1 hypothetical protein [Streptomyces sp. JJ38]